MTSLPRLAETGRHPFTRELLSAGRAERPSLLARRRALSTVTALASTALTSLATGSVSAAAPTGGWATLPVVAKWLGVGILAGTVTVAGASITEAYRAPNGRLNASGPRSTAVSLVGAQTSRQGPALHTGHSADSAPFPPVAETSVLIQPAPATDLGPPLRTPSLGRREDADSAGLVIPPFPDPGAEIADSSEDSAVTEHSANAREAGSVAGVYSSLVQEIGLIDQAKQALTRGDADYALQVLGTYRSRYPDGHFQPECQALEVEAHFKRGELTRAASVREDFLRQYPSNPLGDRLRRLQAPAARRPLTRADSY